MGDIVDSIGKTAVTLQAQQHKYETAKGIIGGIVLGVILAIVGVIFILIGIISGNWIVVLIGVLIAVGGGVLGYFISYMSRKHLKALNQGQGGWADNTQVQANGTTSIS
jgi:protein-S-isoprenylcysteine O-methyltransferase Ste14